MHVVLILYTIELQWGIHKSSTAVSIQQYPVLGCDRTQLIRFFYPRQFIFNLKNLLYIFIQQNHHISTIGVRFFRDLSMFKFCEHSWYYCPFILAFYNIQNKMRRIKVKKCYTIKQNIFYKKSIIIYIFVIQRFFIKN